LPPQIKVRPGGRNHQYTVRNQIGAHDPCPPRPGESRLDEGCFDTVDKDSCGVCNSTEIF
jgi:hypothetical protein